MALGSCACTLAPPASSPSTSGIDGLSRMSSVSALKARPQTPTVLPERTAQGLRRLPQEDQLLPVIHGFGRGQQIELETDLLARSNQRLHILGEA
jgi:hypothetical protein